MGEGQIKDGTNFRCCIVILQRDGKYGGMMCRDGFILAMLDLQAVPMHKWEANQLVQFISMSMDWICSIR